MAKKPTLPHHPISASDFFLHLKESAIPQEILMGVLLDAVSSYNRGSKKLETWQMIGQSFLKGNTHRKMDPTTASSS